MLRRRAQTIRKCYLSIGGYLLRTYLRSLRSSITNVTNDNARTVLVLGNPSADLDSFVSAIVYSYFHNNQSQQLEDGKADSVFAPFVNLPKTPSSELRRLRPEFNFAIQSATAWHDPQESPIKPTEDDSSDLDQSTDD